MGPRARAPLCRGGKAAHARRPLTAELEEAGDAPDAPDAEMADRPDGDAARDSSVGPEEEEPGAGGSDAEEEVGVGLHFPKSFKKFDALARKKKFPEISRARRLGQRYFPKYHVSEGWTSSNLPQTTDFGGFGGLKTNAFFAFGALIHGKTVLR